ncbi:MAG TPA: 50S ribosomal protein L3 [Chloroflexota bacterium]|nr:50S ribosomal protein L3 [Chloroflexota bacterium]
MAAGQLGGLLGRKMGMTQVFDELGQVVPVTVIQAGPCWVTQVKTVESDGYNAVQLGFEESRRLKSPERGHLSKAKTPLLRHLREWRVADPSVFELGQRLDVSIFAPGERVAVIGTSKGKGFQGVVKRHGFSGGPKTHGQSDRHRAPGSIGSGTTPGRVLKGLRMAGRMGAERVTVKNLQVVRADPERNLLLVRGAVPGPREALVMVSKGNADA